MPHGRAETPADVVRALRIAAGSHDKFAAQLGPPATRQLIIEWEKGRGISRRWAERLSAINEDHPPEFFSPPRPTRQTLVRRVDDLERATGELRELLESLRDRLERDPPADPEA